MVWAVSAPAAAAPAVVIRGTAYPIVLPKLRDPRLHLAATITSLQVIGQVGFHFQVSIAQILLALGTSAGARDRRSRSGASTCSCGRRARC